MSSRDRYGARATLADGVDYYRINRLAESGVGDPSRLPMTVKILVENALRHADAPFANEDDVAALTAWDGKRPEHDRERPFVPSRVLLQDFTGVPAVVDLAAMRAAMQRAGGDPGKIDPLVPVDLVVDHSVQVDSFGDARAYGRNIEREYERNRERYMLLRWAQQAFKGFRVVPPGMGIVHQINLEYLARVVQVRDDDGRKVALPDTLVGTDSHTTMVNGIGVLGWGVGGIEAEACMLGQPLFLLSPVVVGVRFHNALPVGTTATDLVLTLTEMLRKHGVVNKFVEFCGAGLSSMTAADRATLSNMAPEYGATASFFPVDARTLEYLRQTGREEEHVDLVERYCREQGMFRTDESETPLFSETLDLDLASIVPSVAGPRRPQDRVALPGVWDSFTAVYGGGGDDRPQRNGDLARLVEEGGNPAGATGNPQPLPAAAGNGRSAKGLADGSVVIAAITSCTNTSNPSVMLAAGLLAQHAVERGLHVAEHVKTSLAPGSRVVTDYLKRAGVSDALDALHFNTVGYGCTTCIGNSGPLPEEVSARIESEDLAVAAVLSGNRNFEGRIHPQVKAAYLASPPLVVAYALAGTLDIDLTSEPLGRGKDGADVFLSDIWPTAEEIADATTRGLQQSMFHDEYARIFDGDEHWQKLPAPTGAMFVWEDDSTYVREPPFFATAGEQPTPPEAIENARVLAVLGDSITTDHISPAGSIAPSSPAAQYLREHGLELRDFNTYGARRGNHEVMIRGTFANIRLRNALAGGREGGWTTHLDSGELMSIYDAAMRYASEGVPLIILAGREYGSGSSRDWAAKGPMLQGVRAVIAQSFERIHRSNLVGMGVLPLQFRDGDSVESLELQGTERYTIRGVAEAGPGVIIEVTAGGEGGDTTFETICRLDSATDVEYFRAGGILLHVLRQLMAG
ncbi:MAG: aconitate hydratase AcnA [Candidatus Dormibacteraeota bacterium]|uniref:Aconitate hydratase n=2 Tax=Candidatus Aeolococcus gillhamiae TaxID=3127015 RepID=A0A934JVY0_9BACT|nr:aconitate hydratase AcnA [Candidatus Dormibacteraeota bacterium]